MEGGTALDRVDSGVAKILDALGAAWVTFLLYPNPGDQVPFQRAVETVNAEAGGTSVTVGPGVFVVAGEEYEARREGVDKLARRLFLHDVELLTLHGGATREGLEALFAVVAEDDAAVREGGGILARLAGTGSSGITVHPRGLLNIGAAGEDAAEAASTAVATSELDLPALARLALSGAAPDEIAAAAAADPDMHPVEAFIEAYRQLHDRVVDADLDPEASLVHGLRLPADDPYKTVRAYIEAFFRLPRWIQIDVLESVLAETGLASSQMFLDQFSGHDLADMLPDLSEPASEQLLGYAVEAAADVAGSGHPLDLLAGLTAAPEVEAARMAVAERVSAALASQEERPATFAQIKAEMEEDIDDGLLETKAVRGLFECEDRRERFQRVARVWTARVSRSIRSGDLRHAADLLDAVQSDRPYAQDHADLVRKALERLITPELLRTLAGTHAGEGGDAAQAVLAGLGRQVIDELIIQLAGEEDKAVRRQLTDLLAAAAAVNPSAVEPYLRDQRWYVVRNLVNALGHTGNRDAARSVRLVVGHTDQRVRTEALRAMVTLLQDEAAPVVLKALSDDSSQVRQAALILLRGPAISDVERRLAAALAEDDLPLESALGVIEILRDRGRADGSAALRALAAKRLALRTRTRTLRRAAQRALESQS